MTSSDTGMVCGWCQHVGSSVAYDFGERAIRRCSACGLMQTYPKATHEELRKIYTREYYKNVDLVDPKSQKVYGYADYIAERLIRQVDHRNILARIDAHLGRANITLRTLCDVGCGLGFFLDSAFDFGFAPRGLEFNEDAVQYATQRYAFPVSTYDGSLLSVLKPSSMAVITSFDTIEHLTEPFEFLAEAREVLVPGGVLVVSTMDSSSFVSRLLGKRLEDFRRILEHLYFFDRCGLTKILQATGYEVLELRSIGHTFELGHLAMRFSTSFPSFSGIARAIQRSALRKVTVSIDPRTKMVVYARKV